jgi:hypothetical protein
MRLVCYSRTIQDRSDEKRKALFGQSTASSLRTLKIKSTYDPTYCKSGPSDRNIYDKGEAIKYNSYDRYLNRTRMKKCKL